MYGLALSFKEKITYIQYNDMTHGSLFSGIGGFDLAAQWMGWDNLFHCEFHPFSQKILRYHFPKAMSYGDIKTVDFTVWRGRVDVLSGGFPCQPFSTAGKRKGTADDRYLWPEMLRAIHEIRPRWVVGENVRGIISWSEGLVFEQVHTDLEAEGYEVQAFVLPACGVDAPHKRERTWFVAHVIENSECNGCEVGVFEKEGADIRKFRDVSTGSSDRVYIQERSIADFNNYGYSASKIGRGLGERDDNHTSGKVNAFEPKGCTVPMSIVAANTIGTGLERENQSGCSEREERMFTWGNTSGCYSPIKNAPNTIGTGLEGRTGTSIRHTRSVYGSKQWQNFPTQPPCLFKR